MKKWFTFLLLVPFSLYSQNSRPEFEGIITYKITILPKDKSLDVKELQRTYGKESLYYFKAGKFKWVPNDTRRLEYEMFNPAISPTSIIAKYRSNDTLFHRDMSKIPDSVTSVKKLKGMEILNIECSSAVFTVTNQLRSTSIFRTVYYPKDTLVYSSTYFKMFKAMGQNFIARYTNAIPLRIEMDRTGQPFSIVYEATEVSWVSIPDKEFEVDNRLPVKR
jgi:hypothetical protein